MPADVSRARVRRARAAVSRCLVGVLVTLSGIVVAAGCARTRLAREVTPRYEIHSSEKHADFGVVYERSGDLDAAARQYQWAVAKEPENIIAWTNLGNVRSQRGEWDQARAAYQAALALNPGYGPAVNNLACTYLDESPPDPAQAETLVREHRDLVDETYQDVIRDTLNRAKGMALP